MIMMKYFTGSSNVLATLLGLGQTKIDPEILTTAMAAAGIIQGGLFMFTPNLSRKMWGIQDDSIYTLAHLEYVGASILSMGVTCFCLFVLKLEETHKTVGWTLVVWAVENSLALLKQYPAKAGGDPTLQILWLFLMLETIRACFMSAAYTYPHAVMAIYSLAALNGILAAVKPRLSANMYGYREVELNDDQLSTLRCFGYESLAMSVFILGLLNDIQAHTALGLTSMVITAHCAHALVGKVFNATYGNFGSLLFYLWMIFHASYAANLLATKEVGYFMGGVIAIVTTLKLPFLFEYPQIAEEELLSKNSWWWKEVHMGI
mmetsp:Transcript_12275/g.17623  ORF Transcript_12275/g.17623 Transcript_12275/m.17623 type:complete len:319 (+) Transcript_12275:200-1156(+)